MVSSGRAVSPSRASAGTVVWFVWMVGMWIAFFALLFVGQLSSLWTAVTQLPVLVEIVLWIAFLPWMLASWVWTGTWPELLRIVAVLVFALGWTAVSIPKPWRRALHL